MQAEFEFNRLVEKKKTSVKKKDFVHLPTRNVQLRHKNIIALVDTLKDIAQFLTTTQAYLPERNHSFTDFQQLSGTTHRRRRRSCGRITFDEFKILNNFEGSDEELDREWVRGLWNQWFDNTFPPEKGETRVYTGQVKVVDEASSGEDLHAEENTDSQSTILPEEIEIPPDLSDFKNEGELTRLKIMVQNMDVDVEQNYGQSNKFTPFFLARRGGILLRLGKVGRALKDLTRAIKAEPRLATAYWHRHLVFNLLGHRSEAMEDLNKLLRINKFHLGALKARGDLFAAMGDDTLAILNYSLAIKIDKTDYGLYLARGEQYLKRGDSATAMEDFSTAYKLNPNMTSTLEKQALFYYRYCNWGNAIYHLNELISKDPLNAEARRLRASCYMETRSYQNALIDLCSSIHLDPLDYEGYFTRGALLRKKHPKRALLDFSTSLLLDNTQKNFKSYLYRGVLYAELGWAQQALDDFQMCLEMDDSRAVVYVCLGLVYMKHFDYINRAIKYFTRAVQVDPSYTRAYMCRHEAYKKIGELNRALKDITKAIHLHPDIGNCYMLRGEVLRKMKNIELANYCIQHAAKLENVLGNNPALVALVQTLMRNFTAAIEVLKISCAKFNTPELYLLLGKTQIKYKKWADAVDSLRRAIALVTPHALTSHHHAGKSPRNKEVKWPKEAAEMFFIFGRCHMEIGNYLLAMEAFTRTIEIDKNHTLSYHERGIARAQMGDKMAILDFNKALHLNPKLFQAFLSRALFYATQGRYSKAILNCNAALKLQPSSVRAYLLRGAFKERIGAFNHALADLTQTISVDPTCYIAYFNRGTSYLNSGRHQEALRDYSIMMLMGEEMKSKVMVNRGLAYLELQDYSNALEDLIAARESHQNDLLIHHAIGFCYHKLGLLEEAVESYTEAVQLDAFFVKALVGRGNVFMDSEDELGRTCAKHDYERAMVLDPMCFEARVNLGYLLQVSGKYMQAWKQLTTVINIAPYYQPALEGRAVLSLQMSNAYEAWQDLSRAIECRGTAELFTNRGVVDQFLGYLDRAMGDYRMAITLDPTYALAYYNAGNLLFSSKLFRQALKQYDKCIEHNPMDEAAHLNRAITKTLLRNMEGALEDFEIAISLSPNSAHMYYNRGNLYMYMGKQDLAVSDYSKSLELQPDDPVVLRHRAEVLAQMGQCEEAIEDYKKAVHIKEYQKMSGETKIKAKKNTTTSF